jgi:hypothetical protein
MASDAPDIFVEDPLKKPQEHFRIDGSKVRLPK